MFNLEGIRLRRNEERCGDIAQLGERLPCKQEVAGSIPTISTNFLSRKKVGKESFKLDLCKRKQRLLPQGTGPKPNEVGSDRRGGARERTQFSPQAETELSGLCGDEMVGGRWKPTRIEYAAAWYLVGIRADDLNGLRVRI